MCCMSHVFVVIIFVSAHGCAGYDEEALNSVNHKYRARRDVGANTHLEVSSLEVAPYLMRRTVLDSQSSKYKGFIPDLLDKISKETSITFNIHISEDARYGMPDDTSDVGWSGMIGEVMRMEKAVTDNTNTDDATNVADIAAAPITMTGIRQQVVSFINPFQHAGLILLTKKASLKDMSEDVQNSNIQLFGYSTQHAVAFKVLGVLSPAVWVCSTLAFILVTLLFWGNNRMNPYEWGGRYNLGRATDDQAQQFNLSGSFWFTFTTLQWQGYDCGPRSISSRVLAGSWFCFVTISLVTYTGSIVNNLFWASTVHETIGPREVGFRDLETLLLNPEYKVGIIKGGATYKYITQLAYGQEFERLKAWFASDTSLQYQANDVTQAAAMLRNKTEGAEKIAFIMEMHEAHHLANTKPCDLVTVGPVFGKRAFGMPYRNNLDKDVVQALHTAILDLQLQGDIEALEKRWFHYGDCWNTTRFEKMFDTTMMYLNKPSSIKLSTFWGPLLLLVLGIIVSIGVAVAEIFYFKYKGRYQPQNQPGGKPLRLEEDNTIE